MTLRISFANKTRKKNLPLLRVAGPRSSPIVMTKCRATCLLCKYHASKIDSSFHNWLNWGLALFQLHQHEVLTSVHGSAFSTFYSIYSYMDAKWRKLNATLTAQTNQNDVLPENFFFLKYSLKLFKKLSEGYAISSTRRRVLSFWKLGLVNSCMAIVDGLVK